MRQYDRYGITHEIKIYASARHPRARHGDLLLHLWFKGESAMQLDREIALARRDVAYIDVLDCVTGVSAREYPG